MHSNFAAVDAILERAAVTGPVPILDEAAPTAAAAAALVGVEVRAIANSLDFATAEDEPLLVLTSGAHRRWTPPRSLPGTVALADRV